jgi:maltose alpha-D-glucosyltransferase/alpha-amylase
MVTPGANSSNTVVSLGDRLFVKGYRRLSAGVNPEVEIGRYLTEVAHFAHAVPVAGSVEYVADDGQRATLALLQGYVQNQGDGWAYTQHYLDKFFDDAARDAPGVAGADVHGGYMTLARTLGVRTAELHRAFAQGAGDPAFAPEPMTAAEIAALAERVRSEAAAGLDRLAQRLPSLADAVRGVAERVLAQRERLLARIARHAGDRTAGPRTRIHGDYHLGQVLLVQNDFVITDFEGEPTRPLEERARKQSPLKDVAGMLRSLDYALHAALFDFRTERPDVHERIGAAGRQWREQAARAFLDGYDEIARAGRLASAHAESGGLLELFVLEKALYEVAYESENRPDWLAIPLRGLLDVLDAP